MTPAKKPPEPQLLSLELVPRSWDRYPTGRAQADNTAHWVWCHVLGAVTYRAGPRLTTQPKSSRAQPGVFFPQAGKSAPVGVRTPHLRVPLAAPRPTELTTFGLYDLLSNILLLNIRDNCSSVAKKKKKKIGHCCFKDSPT